MYARLTRYEGPPERIAPIGWAGAALVVAGSAAVSLLNARR